VAVKNVVVRRRIGSGVERVVYLHPVWEDIVIKINRDVPIDRNDIDYTYLSRIETIPVLPKMYGWVETQLGRGLMFERIHDDDGKTSLNLVEALRWERITIEEGRSLLQEALAALLKHGIILHDDENVNNFLVQNTASGRQLILVDGFGPFVMTAKARLRMRFPRLGREKALRSSYNLLAAYEKEVQKLWLEKTLLEDA